jgi:(1->4)-alpha-D-glucan 1-alpha-D-glucosylmutase
VDPDNRGLVDFERRSQMLETLCAGGWSPAALASSWQDGSIKMFVTARGLQFRKKHSPLFLKGAYLPLRAHGPQKDCVIAFARRYRGAWSIVVAPRFTTRLADWGGTSILVPNEAPIRWTNVFDEEPALVDGDSRLLHIERVLSRFPVALLSNTDEENALCSE